MLCWVPQIRISSTHSAFRRCGDISNRVEKLRSLLEHKIDSHTEMTEEVLIQKGYIKDDDGNWSKPKRAQADIFHDHPLLCRDSSGTSGDKEKKGQAGTKDAERSLVESNSGIGTLGPSCVQKSTGQNVLIRITCIRSRLLDEDNLCEKYVVDLLRNSGIIFDDAPDRTKIEVCQKKAGKNLGEFNLIEVFEL